MTKKLSESEIVERMRSAREDALTAKDQDQAQRARQRLKHLLCRYREVGRAYGIESVGAGEGSFFQVLKPGEPGFVGKIK